MILLIKLNRKRRIDDAVMWIVVASRSALYFPIIFLLRRRVKETESERF